MGDSYLPGAAVLAKSLRDEGTQKKLACMVVQENLRPTTITELQVRELETRLTPCITDTFQSRFMTMSYPCLQYRLLTWLLST